MDTMLMVGDIHKLNTNIVSVHLLNIQFHLGDVVDVTNSDVNRHFTPCP